MGGIKKKFQMIALKKAAIKTGIISKRIDKMETANNKINAVTW